jgi:hypothetical protein
LFVVYGAFWGACVTSVLPSKKRVI